MKHFNRTVIDETFANMFSNPTYSEYVFYAHMVGQCNIKLNDELPSPAGVMFKTDHYELYINPIEFEQFPIEQRVGIIKHEILHVLYKHVQRKGDRQHLPFNFSTDCAINQHINRKHLPEFCIFPDNFPVSNCPVNESAEFYYDLLKNEAEEQWNNMSDEEKQEAMEQSGYGQVLDNHELWEESEGDEDLQKDITKDMIEKAVSATQKSRGDLPSNIDEMLKLHSRNAQVSWKKVLKNIVGNKKANSRKTIMKSDRRFPKREDLKGKTKDRTFNLLVISDVSGSVDDEALLELLGEVQHICKLTKTDLDLIQVDAEAYPPEKLSKKTKIIQRKAQGGTKLFPAIDMANKHKLDYQAIVITTDGYLCNEEVEQFNALNKKIIWLIEKNGEIMDGMNFGKSRAFKLEK